MDPHPPTPTHTREAQRNISTTVNEKKTEVQTERSGLKSEEGREEGAASRERRETGRDPGRFRKRRKEGQRI